MEKAVRICKICGAEYPYCKTEHPYDQFYWRDVACCPEHASLYFADVMRARGEAMPVSEPVQEQERDEPAKKSGKKKH